jgi:Na+/alanine symporter
LECRHKKRAPLLGRISNPVAEADTTAEAVSEVFGIGKVPVGVVLAVLIGMVTDVSIKRVT